MYDELVSNEDYVVIDGKDINMLIEEMRAQGLDDIGDSSASLADSVLEAAERVDSVLSGEQKGISGLGGVGSLAASSATNMPAVEPASTASPSSPDTPVVAPDHRSSGNQDQPVQNFGGVSPGENAMEYFTDDNLSFMPSWAREAFLNGSHNELEKGANRLGQDRGTRRLDAIVNAGKARSREGEVAERLRKTGPGVAADDVEEDGADSVGPEVLDAEEGEDDVVGLRRADGGENITDDVAAPGASPALDGDDQPPASFGVGTIAEDWEGEGILDCTVEDVAVDYNIPVELVVDIMWTYGVALPIKPSHGIRDSMTTDEIAQLLELITSFDCMDLSDRYSDHTLTELAEEYDTDVKLLVDACQAEGIYLALGKNTRLQLSREDRVLDIARGRATAGGFDYPPLLHGLSKFFSFLYKLADYLLL